MIRSKAQLDFQRGQMAKIILIRGMSTSGSDDLGFGPVQLGPLLAKLQDSLLDHGLKTSTIEDLGNGNLQSHVDIALNKLKMFNEDLHLVGYSMGGLIARQCAEHLKNVVAVTTLATPHHGSVMADLALELHEIKPKLYWFMNTAGYTFSDKLIIFNDLSTAMIQKWNAERQFPPGVDGGSFQFSTPSPNAFIRFLNQHIPRARKPEATDGYVELESQKWMKPLGHFKLDHLSAIGWNFHVRPNRRAFVRQEYNRFIESLVQRLKHF